MVFGSESFVLVTAFSDEVGKAAVEERFERNPGFDGEGVVVCKAEGGVIGEVAFVEVPGR